MTTMPGLDVADDARRAIRDMIKREHADPAFRAMMVEIEERHRRVQEKYKDADVTALGEDEWREWLSAHHYDARERAKNLRAQHRRILKLAARAAGQPWKPNDPRALGQPGSPDPA